MKATYTRTLARKILLAFLAFVIAFSVVALFVRKTITEKLENISKLANNVGRNQDKPEQALLLLHQAEDDFQASLLNTDSTKRHDYKTKLSLAFDKIDTLLKEQTDTTHLTAAQTQKVQYWYRKKLALSAHLYQLKHGFDSLLTVYAIFNTAVDKNSPETMPAVYHIKKDSKNNADTVKKVTAAQKKGLFGRIKDAIVNKNSNTASKSIVEIHHNSKTNVTDLATQRIAAQDKKNYANKLKQLQQLNIRLMDMQRELIILNTHISNELEHIINDVKDMNYSMADEFREMSFKSYQETTVLLNNLYLTALFLVLLFAVLLIVFILQLNNSELLLRKENERSVTMAQQKMDLLLSMSHEIRNPLTAIKGFLYIFSKTNLSEKQIEMLDSIRLSSDMLLRTLNDTLDAAKMENSEFKIHADPFNPDLTLKSVVENMGFSAAKKNLTLKYNFKGDAGTLVLGDGFRLKQIMVNLLSNAIKYTSQGGVTVTAELLGTESKLKVDISDTGAGISAEQQSNLFSKYYRTNSSKGQVGTGLGLFICKQLVELQGGKITVRSNPEAGTTFSFFIPYQKSDNKSVVQPIDDPLSLITGISILAVDDNEFNLLFLKMMMDKWNVKFFQAFNGKEALDVISKNEITVVLTDIEMPEMDGNALLAAIRKLHKPLNQLPVIVISGATEPGDAEKFLKAGFSGVIGKPFTKAEVIEQMVKTLK
jgi:two-component system sensor histidine kinase BarA